MTECRTCGHDDEMEDFDWESYTHHMEDYEEKYAYALGIKIDKDGWTACGEQGDLDDSLRDYIFERIKVLVGAKALL